MKSLFIIALLYLGCLQIFADSWGAQQPQTVSSPEGKYLLRSIPPILLDEENEKWSKMLFIVYALDEQTQDYQEKSRFKVEGRPLELFIDDAGTRIVTMDQHVGIGKGPRTVVVYDLKGAELKKWALKDFYDKKKLAKLPRSTTSTHWRGVAGWMSDQKRIWIWKASSSEDADEEFDDYILDVQGLNITSASEQK